MKNLVSPTGILCLLMIAFLSCENEIHNELIQIEQNYDSLGEGFKSGVITGFDIYGYNWSEHHFHGYLLNAWIGDHLVSPGNSFHWDPCTDDTKDYLERYSADDCFFWNFSDWTTHYLKGSLRNTSLGDNLVALADYYHWDPYTGDAEGYLEKYPAEDYFFWDFREITLVMHWNEALISSEGVYQDTWLGSDAWITFHYKMGGGKDKWSQFQKMIAVKESDTLIKDEDGYGLYWENKDGEFIGYYYMWPDLALIQVVNTGNVPEGLCPAYKGPMSPGLEKYKTRN